MPSASALLRGWHKMKTDMASADYTFARSMPSRSISMPSVAPILSELPVDGLCVSNTIMREKNISYHHQFLAVEVAWRSRCSYGQKKMSVADPSGQHG